MPRSVLALTFLGSTVSAASYHFAASSYRSASKYKLPSCTRVSASDGFRSAVAFSDAARDSSKTGGADWVPAAPDGAAAAAGAGVGGATPDACWLPIIQPTRTPKKMPATPNTTESLLIAKRSGSTGFYQVLRGSTGFVQVSTGFVRGFHDSMNEPCRTL